MTILDHTKHVLWVLAIQIMLVNNFAGEVDMVISAQIENSSGEQRITLKTNEREHSLMIAPKAEGRGSSANGGELLMLAVATCYCNDLYREANKRGIEVQSVEVDVHGEFGGEGDPARRIWYRAAVAATGLMDEILDLMDHTDSVAEIHNTLRKACPVIFSEREVREI